MTERLPTKALQRQREALDAACTELGLSPGVPLPGRKHWKYRVETPRGVATVSMCCTPKDADETVRVSRSRLRGQILYLLMCREGDHA